MNFVQVLEEPKPSYDIIVLYYYISNYRYHKMNKTGSFCLVSKLHYVWKSW